jgi:RNA polymerase sigma-70 factor (ECF subfamily)
MPLDNPRTRGLSWQSRSPDARTPYPPPRVPHDPDAPSPPGEESEWIQAAQGGDRHAFARLVDRYWDRLYRWLYHLTRDRHQAEDLAQETFLKALAAIGSFRPGSNFRAWLFRIGHNNFVNLKRTERRTKHPLPDDAAAPAAAGPLDVAADREAVTAVARAVGQLPIEFRAALLLHTQEGLSYREVAVILRTTEETARWRVFKARQKLMRVLAPELLPPGARADVKAEPT